MTTRREFLCIVPLIATVGCGEPKQRVLALGDTATTWVAADGVVEGTVEVTSRSASDDWATFHDIEIVGYDSSRPRCRVNIGTLTTGDSTAFRLDCDSRPPYLTFTAKEGPCDGNTLIGVYEYVENNIGEYYTGDGYKDCNDGDFPTPE